jgi:hypothetical protein
VLLVILLCVTYFIEFRLQVGGREWEGGEWEGAEREGGRGLQCLEVNLCII